MRNQDHRAGVGNFPGGQGKSEDKKSLPRAEKTEATRQRPAGATSTGDVEDEESRPTDGRGQPPRSRGRGQS